MQQRRVKLNEPPEHFTLKTLSPFIDESLILKAKRIIVTIVYVLTETIAY
jgi:hypothetical protein